jgi:hypothetical protein
VASTYSPSLRLELIGDGDQSGIWGQTTNNNLGALIEQAISGVVAITMADANYTMSNYNGVVDEARNQVLVVAGALTATRNLVAPLVEKTYLVKNSTTGGQSIQIIGSSGLGVTIPNGITTYVYCDGTNFYNALSGSVGNFTVNGNLAITGNETITGTLGVTGAQTNSSTLQATTITATTQFTGPATGLTGTAASLSIGGNAATATAATRITNSGGWNVTPSGTKLYFNYNGTNVGSLDSSGNFIVTGNVTAYGTA